VIEQLQAFCEEHHISSFADLERVIVNSGVEIAPWDIDPTTDGAALSAGGTRYILIKPYLNHYRRALALAHEAGHVCLHLNDPPPQGIQLATGGIQDIEADCFLVLCLGATLPNRFADQARHLFPYVLHTPTMMRRMFLVHLYLAVYGLRMGLADALAWLFLPTPSHERN
jgi:hypothetical protein